MKKLGRENFNERLKQTMFAQKQIQNDGNKYSSYIKPSHPYTAKVLSKVKTASMLTLPKWLKPRKMRKHEKFALASLLTYAIYMMQMAQHF